MAMLKLLRVGRYGAAMTALFTGGGAVVLTILGLRGLPFLAWVVVFAIAIGSLLYLDRLVQKVKNSQIDQALRVGSSSTVGAFVGLNILVSHLGLLLQTVIIPSNIDLMGILMTIWAGLVDMVMVMSGIQISLAMLLLNLQLYTKGIYAVGSLDQHARQLGNNGPFIREMVAAAIIALIGATASKAILGAILTLMGATFVLP